MNEEQSVLHFFAQPENLPLTFSVAEQSDEIRRDLNNRFWLDLLPRTGSVTSSLAPDGRFELTEDKNRADFYVGLHSTLIEPQDIYLRPMMEQQFLGDEWRIYYGLMWSDSPRPEHLALPSVSALEQSLAVSGFRKNTGFLGWQWTNHYPRSRNFLLRYSQAPDTLLDEFSGLLERLIEDRTELITQANDDLKRVVTAQPISLGRLRPKG